MALVKRTLKLLICLIIILILVFALGVFVLVKWVNPNSFKPEIITAVENATGRTLTLPGDLSWSFYPYLGLHIGNAALSNPSGFSQNTFAEINSADLAVNFMDLLQGKIVFDRLNLNGLHLFLVEQQHATNWTFSPAVNKVEQNSKQNNVHKQNYSFTIQSLNIENGSVSFDNYLTKNHYVLNNLNLTANGLRLGEAFPLAFSSDFSLNQDLTGTLKLNTQLSFDADSEMLQLNNLALQTSLLYPTETGEAMNIVNQYSAELLQVNFAEQSLSIPHFNFVINQEVKGVGTIMGKTLFTEPLISGQLTSNTFSLNDLLNSLGISPPMLPNKTLLDQVQLSSHFIIGLNHSNVMFNPIMLSVGNSHLQGDLRLFWSPFSLTEHLQVDQMDLADFISLQGASLPLSGLSSNGEIKVQDFADAVFPRTLNGNINLQIQNIILKGFDLHAMLQNIQSLISNSHNLTALTASSAALEQQLQGVAPQGKLNPNNGQSTRLGVLKAKINIHHGLVTTPVMNLEGPEVVVNGTGQVDLVTETVKYQLLAKVIASESNFIKSLSIPYDISGTFSNLTQGINWTELNAQIVEYLAKALGSVVQNVVTSAVSSIANGGQSVGTAVKENAVKALNSIFGGGS